MRSGASMKLSGIGERFPAPGSRWCALLLVVPLAVGCSKPPEHRLFISAEEFDAAAVAVEEPPLRGKVERGAPVIVVDRPEPDAPVVPPFDVVVRFETTDGAKIVLDTLRIKYGLIDMTKRVLERLVVGTDGIKGEIDAIRSGRYKLRISVTDDRQRTGRATLTFRIADPP